MPLPKDFLDSKIQADREIVLEMLKEWIITQQFEPNEKIADLEIAKYFGLSRTPVREAIKILEQQKLIRTYPGRATVVAPMELEHMDELYVPMVVLQCQAARMAAEKIRMEDLNELIELNEDFYLKICKAEPDAFEIHRADRAFHGKIVEIAGNPYIRDFCDVLWTHIARLDYLYFHSTGKKICSYHEHLEIIRALRLNDGLGASIEMRKNWENSMMEIKALIGAEQKQE